MWLFVLPTDSDRQGLLGFSTARIILLGLAALLAGGSFFLYFRFDTFRAEWFDPQKKSRLWDLIYIASVFSIWLAPSVILTLYGIPGSTAYVAYAERLSPLAFWFTLSGLEFVAFIISTGWGAAKPIFQQQRLLIKTSIFILLLLFLISVIVGVTKIGITPVSDWGGPGVPFFEWQILLALLILLAIAFLPRKILDVREKWIVIGIYVITLALWLSQPVNPAYFATTPRAPNYEVYPFSDGLVYAQYAQSALVGNGFLYPEVPSRPFYLAILTWLHVFAGQDYNHVIFLQTILLGLFPVLLYIVGREFGGRPVGIALALLAVFRDMNTNLAAPFSSSVTYSKLYFSEIPTAIFISAVTILCLRWMRSSKPPSWLPLLTGGMLGVATLIRSQSLILIAVIVLIAFLIRPTFKQWLITSIYLVIGFLIVLLPWMIRNDIASGGFVLDNPFTQTMTMTRRWKGIEGNVILPRLPNETDAEYSSRMMSEAIGILKSDPQFILRTAANHFINNEVDSLRAFPIRDQLLSPRELIAPQHAFWEKPLTSRQIPLFAFNLLIFSVGLGAAFRYRGLPGLLPLGFGMAYNAWSALFFTSGGRFIVPLDWSIFLYQVYGLILLGGMILSFAGGARENISAWLQGVKIESKPIESTVADSRRLILTFSLVLFLGLFLPLTENAFPEKYPPLTQEEIAAKISVPLEDGEVAIYGRAIYPRYYEAGDGEPETAKTGYAPADNARLIFFVVGSSNALVVFNLSEVPDYFPNAADVILIGKYAENYFAPRVVKVFHDSQSETYFNP